MERSKEHMGTDRKGRVMAAMSGGVDSAVAAYLLKEQGYEVVGVTMCLGVDTGDDGKVRCCGPREIEDARRVCTALDIGHHVLNFGPELREWVIEPFIREYREGRTPNPCVECNRHIKFGDLLAKAMAMEFDRLATGHYARIGIVNGAYRLTRARDTRKDQTYFLSAIGREALERVLFPLADYTKDEVRALAQKANLPVSDKPESQDVCFITDGGTDKFLREHIEVVPGDIVDLRGNVVGRHRGIALYTIGQRARLGLNWGKPVYVVKKDPAANRIVVGEKELLLSPGLSAGQVILFVDNLPSRALAKIRYAHTPAPCSASLENGRLEVRFDEPQEAITAGQTVALYDGDGLLASGIIQEVLK
jgi:tRNA-uridine 2-sulfurtransferase